MPDEESPPNVGLAAGRRRLSPKNRSFRLVGTIVVTGLAALYIVSKIDLGKTFHITGRANLAWLALSAFLTVITVPPQAWRWQLLLRVRGIDDSFAWLTRAYFVSYAVGQVLPTAVGGDASRIYETTRATPARARRSPARSLLERAIGGAVTLLLAAVGFLLAIGHYDIGAVPLDRGALRRRDVRRRGRRLLGADAPLPAPRRAAAAPSANRAARPRRLRGDPRLPPPRPARS